MTRTKKTYNPSQAAKERRNARNRAARSGHSCTKKKPGHPGAWHGQRLAFLQEHQAEFLAICKQDGDQGAFWSELFPLYWAKFPWRLPMNEEPEEGAEPVEEDDDDLPEEEQELKAQVVKKTTDVSHGSSHPVP